MTEPAKIHPLKIADARRAIRHLFVRDLVLDAPIGVHAHEKTGAQPVRINVDLSIAENDVPHDDALARVVCYERLVDDIKEIVIAEHINLVETLAERIAEVVPWRSPRSRCARPGRKAQCYRRSRQRWRRNRALEARPSGPGRDLAGLSACVKRRILYTGRNDLGRAAENRQKWGIG